MLALVLAATAADARAQGELVVWGDDYHENNVPAGPFTAVAAGDSSNVAIRADGTLVEWPSTGMAPAGTFSDVAMQGGHNFAVGLRTDGTLVTWGYDAYGNPAADPPAGTFTAVAASEGIGVAIRVDQTLAAWGKGAFGSPPTVPPAGAYIDVAASVDAGVAIRTDGSLESWTLELYGFGDPPEPPSGTFTDVAAGWGHYVAIRTDGTLVSWGADNFGQVSGTPAGTYSAVAAGGYHSVAIRDDGTLVSWGHDSEGQVSETPAGTYSAVAAGAYHSVAITGGGNEPPVIMCNDPVALWSPNHELVDASAAISVFDPDGDAVMLTIRVFSDETEVPDTGDGTGKHAPDFKDELYDGGRGLLVRSERRAAEDGRFYVGVITADDGHGGVTTAVCPVAVCPHDQTEESLNDVLAQADAAAAFVLGHVEAGTLPASPDAPAGLYEHGLSEESGPNQ